LYRHGMEHLHVFRIRVVARERVIELGIQRDDLDTQGFQNARGKVNGRAVTAGHNSPDPALEKSALGKIADIGTGKILDEAICAALACLVTAGQNDVAQSRHFIRAESDWTFGA